jgi:uncharacterized protein YceH (UPF0502 family)
MDDAEDLSPPELRVLGCLIEKEATTPDQYPLTLNSLTLACNQSTNRDPVVSYDQDTVLEALSGLREKQLARLLYPAHGRVTKYRHVMGETWALTAEELAVLAVLMIATASTLVTSEASRVSSTGWPTDQKHWSSGSTVRSGNERTATPTCWPGHRT